MKILVFGAGALGSLYAARLKAAGHLVRVLARGRRLEDIRRYGLVLENMITARRTFVAADAVDSLGPEDHYDLVLVTVRKTQLAGILPALAANRRTPNVLFMVCGAAGPADVVAAVGRDRALLGCTGMRAALRGPVVRYADVPRALQTTVIGESRGRTSARVRAIRDVLRRAGFPTASTPNMDAWLKTRAAWIVPVLLSIGRQGGNPGRLASTPTSLRLMVLSIRETTAALRSLDIPVTGPLWARLQSRLSEALLTAFWKRALRTEMIRRAAAHGIETLDEMGWVVADLRALMASAGTASPALDELLALSCFGNPFPVRTP